MTTESKARKGERVRSFFNSECAALLALYKNIETLIPAPERNGAQHVGEEGRFIEALVRSFLNKHLPNGLEALSGFVLRPAAKVGDHDRERRETEEDTHSTQLDVIVYDSANYPVYERFEEFVIVPPEGVVAIVSVKKNLYANQLKDELRKLSQAAALCNTRDRDKAHRRGPGTLLLAFGNKMDERKDFDSWTDGVFKKVKAVHCDHYFDQCIGAIICLDSFTVFKERPNSPVESTFDKQATYLAFDHHKADARHFGLQFLLTCILAAYHHPTRSGNARPGFTSFPTNKKRDRLLGQIDVTSLRFPLPPAVPAL